MIGFIKFCSIYWDPVKVFSSVLNISSYYLYYYVSVNLVFELKITFFLFLATHKVFASLNLVYMCACVCAYSSRGVYVQPSQQIIWGATQKTRSPECNYRVHRSFRIHGRLQQFDIQGFVF